MNTLKEARKMSEANNISMEEAIKIISETHTVSFDEAIERMSKMKSPEVFKCGGEYTIIEDGDGQNPFAWITRETFEALRRKGQLGSNCLVSFKGRELYPFKGTKIYNKQKEENLPENYANNIRDGILDANDPLRILTKRRRKK